MAKVTFKRFYLILILLFIISCSKDIDLTDSTSSNQDNFVELSLAKEIATKVSFEDKNNSIFQKGISIEHITKNIKNINEITNVKGRTSFYIINYKEGGFLLLSADKRTEPILGYSEQGEFSFNEESYPLGLKFWMEDAKNQINDIQNSNIKLSEINKKVWENIQLTSTPIKQSPTAKPPVDECEERTEVYTVGPLLKTVWNQQGAYNDALPFISCNGSNFQVYAGCVPVAMAQVMKYYNYPINYNWSQMPVNQGTSTTANLILDIHNAIRSSFAGYPNYSCSSTGVSSSANMGNVLKDAFNYTSADWADYNYQIVKANISAGKPVILSGSTGSSGHMWVCDGYRSTSFFYEDCSGVSYLYLSMNWGWGGTNDGWFAFNNFNSGNGTFNDNRKMIYNIKP